MGREQPNMADDQDDASSSEDAKGLRKQLQEAQAELQRAKAEAEQVKQQATREAAFAKAGIPDSGMGDMFRKAYEGDLTPDAIKARALEVGLIAQERDTPSDERDQLLSLQSDQIPGQRPADRSVIADLQTKISTMTDNEAIFDLLREHGLLAG